jgi:hypothetical protein
MKLYSLKINQIEGFELKNLQLIMGGECCCAATNCSSVECCED